jgi:hypothetical protein
MAGPEVRHGHPVTAHPGVGRQGEVAGGFGAETVLLGLPGRPRPAPALGKLSRHGVLVKAHSRLLWDDRYLTGPSRRTLAIAATRSSGLRGRRGCFADPGRSGGNDHGRFRSHFGVQVFEKPSGRPDLNRRPLDPQNGGAGGFAAQRRSACRTRQVVTCGLFGRMYAVWSPSGPHRSTRRCHYSMSRLT